MLSLVERVREETAARDRKVDVLERGHQQMRWVIGLAVALVLVMLGFGIVNAVNLSATRTTNRTLLDCVNSTGACGRANSAAQAEILNTVKLYELTVMYCARTNPRDVDANGDKFIACVNELYPGAPQLDRHGE
jgi:predicted metal-binding membrane protein